MIIEVEEGEVIQFEDDDFSYKIISADPLRFEKVDSLLFPLPD